MAIPDRRTFDGLRAYLPVVDGVATPAARAFMDLDAALAAHAAALGHLDRAEARLIPARGGVDVDQSAQATVAPRPHDGVHGAAAGLERYVGARASDRPRHRGLGSRRRSFIVRQMRERRLAGRVREAADRLHHAPVETYDDIALKFAAIIAAGEVGPPDAGVIRSECRGSACAKVSPATHRKAAKLLYETATPTGGAKWFDPRSAGGRALQPRGMRLTTHDHHLGMPEANRSAQGVPRAARDAMPGPIAPIDHFGNDRGQILSRYIREGLIPSLMLDGVAYVSYSDVYGDLLSDHFHSEFDSPEAWDGTYAMSWSPWRRVTGAWLKPRGLKDAVRSEMFPRISLDRETRYVDDDEGEPYRITVAYPRHVADRAAEMFRALYREEGFIERFHQWGFEETEVVVPLAEFSDHEVELFKGFVAEGAFRFSRLRGQDYIARSKLMYYDLFDAKVIEDEHVFDFDPAEGLNHMIEVMVDGTFIRGRFSRHPTVLRPKQASRTDQ